MSEATWPEQWSEWRAGTGCPACEAGRVEEDETGIRFHAGSFADAYLQRRQVQPGYSIVVLRGRHAADVVELSDEELSGYWREVRVVARMIQVTFEPYHLNHQLLGNALPHLHTHIVPRYRHDPAPGRPLPGSSWAGSAEVGEDELRAQVAALRSARRWEPGRGARTSRARRWGGGRTGPEDAEVMTAEEEFATRHVRRDISAG